MVDDRAELPPLVIARRPPSRGGISVHTEWAPLEEVILGSCRHFNLDSFDPTIVFLYDDPNKVRPDTEEPKIAQRYIEEREEDLEAVAALLTAEGVTVRRAERLAEASPITTPDFASVTTSCDAPRDMFLAYSSMLLETPPTNRKRYFEGRLIRSIARRYFDLGSTWICAPRPLLAEDSLDLTPWRLTYDEPLLEPASVAVEMDIAFDAANVLRFGRDLVMNIGTRNHLLGAYWLSSVVPESTRLHVTRLCDSHLDGHIMPIAPGRLLVNEGAMYGRYDRLPRELRAWDRIPILDPAIVFDYPSDHLQLATSVGMSVNVLSLDESRLLIRDSATLTIRALERAGFTPIPVRLRHNELFGGGLHCATVDVRRRDSPDGYL